MELPNPPNDPYLNLVRPRVETPVTFWRTSSRRIKQPLRLTPSQCDVIATLFIRPFFERAVPHQEVEQARRSCCESGTVASSEQDSAIERRDRQLCPCPVTRTGRIQFSEEGAVLLLMERVGKETVWPDETKGAPSVRRQVCRGLFRKRCA